MLIAMISTVDRVKLDTDLRRKKEPLSHWVAEEDQLHKIRWVLWPAGNNERQEQACVLGDEIITDLSNEEKGKDSETLTDGTLAVRWIAPHERHVSDTGLGPALSPSHALFPERRKVCGSHLIRKDVHIVHSLLALAVRTKRGVDIFAQHMSMHEMSLE